FRATKLRMLRLLNLKYQIQVDEDKDDLALFLAEIARSGTLSPEEVNSVENTFAAVRSDRLRLRTALINFIDSQLYVLERENARKTAHLWEVVAKVRQSYPSPKYDIVLGYKALIELDAPLFAKALQTGLSEIAASKTPDEVRVSVGLIARDAKDFVSV